MLPAISTPAISTMPSPSANCTTLFCGTGGAGYRAAGGQGCPPHGPAGGRAYPAGGGG
jgi:hypothetical protein